MQDPKNLKRAKERASAAELYAMVKLAMGEGFAGSVKACLHPTRTWETARELVKGGKIEEGYQKTLEDYYTYVYSP